MPKLIMRDNRIPGQILVFLWAFVLAACGGQPAPQVTATAVTPTLTATLAPSATFTASPTQTPTVIPTVTFTPTSTATPTLTSTPIPESVIAWCMPVGFPVPIAPPATMPSQGIAAQTGANGALRLKAPVSSCTFLYTFNQALQNDLDLHIYDRASQPFLKVKLSPLAGNPNKAAVTLTHSYIADPPFWEIAYRFQVVQLNGSKRREDQVVVYKATPPLCWNERLPDPVTYQCPDLDGDWNIDRPETWKGRDW
jgi:hypothetical protein